MKDVVMAPKLLKPQMSQYIIDGYYRPLHNKLILWVISDLTYCRRTFQLKQKHTEISVYGDIRLVRLCIVSIWGYYGIIWMLLMDKVTAEGWFDRREV